MQPDAPSYVALFVSMGPPSNATELRLARLGLWVWLAAFLASAGRMLMAVA
jgi:hypothetical protein